MPSTKPFLVPWSLSTKGGKVDNSGSQNLQRTRTTQLARLARLAQVTQVAKITPDISRKVSICPIKMTDASIEMIVPTGRPSVSTTRPDDDRYDESYNTRYSANSANRASNQPPRVQRVKMSQVPVVTLVQKLPAPAPRAGQQKVEIHLIPGTDLCISATGKTLVTDIVSVFGAVNEEKMSVDSLLHHLCNDSTKPWATYFEGRPIKAKQLNSVLTNEFGVHSYDIRVGKSRGGNPGKVVKGLHRKVFELLKVLLNGRTVTQNPY